MAALSCAGLFSLPARAAEPASPSVSAIYTRMALAMRQESPAAALSYRETFVPAGLTISIAGAKGDDVRPRLVFAPRTQPAVFDVSQRADGVSDVVDRTTGARFTGSSLFWAPTWWAVHTSGAVAADSASSPTAAGAGLFDSGRSRVVADALAISDRYYRMELDDTAGDATTYHLRLTARTDPQAHPLTDLYVDRQTYLLRSAVAAFKNETPVSGFAGTMRLDFGRMQSYWTVVGGTVSARAHVLLRHARGSTDFTLSDVTVQSG
ncbi:MAG TPA: hypothetical protein VHT05_00545 [Candidatus Elarobacter sp.]|nr:hypothetical protein [Candidatus Elarobacter sp.]